MFRSLILCLNLVIYIGALLTVAACAFSGPDITEALGLSTSDLVISYGIGALTGIFSASILFGIPIVLLNINANLAQAVELLKTMQQPPSLIQAVTPVLLDHALDSLGSD